MATTHKTRRDYECEAARYLEEHAVILLGSPTVVDDSNVLVAHFKMAGRKYRVTIAVEAQDEE